MVFSVGAVLAAGGAEPPGGAARSWHEQTMGDVDEENAEMAAIYMAGHLQVRDEQAMANHLLASCCAAAREDPGHEEHRAAAAPVEEKPAAAAPVEEKPAAAPVRKQKRRVAAAPAAPAEAPPKVKLDTAAACSCFAPAFGLGSPEQALNAELSHAGGGGIRTHGVSREVQLHTGDVIIPSCGVVSDVHDNLHAAHDYAGPDGEYVAWLCGKQSLLLHRGKDAALIAGISMAV